MTKNEESGVFLDTSSAHWELEGPRYFTDLFCALQGWLPEASILYFEDGSPDEEISEFFRRNSISPNVSITLGTAWPKPKYAHVPATEELLVVLAGIMDRHAGPELALHFHVYQNEKILLQWHDAFSQPMLLSPCFNEQKVKKLSEKFGTNFQKIQECKLS